MDYLTQPVSPEPSASSGSDTEDEYPEGLQAAEELREFLLSDATGGNFRDREHDAQVGRSFP